MNTPSLSVALAFVGAVSLAAPLLPQTTPIKICPLGDSITESFIGQPSYRYYLDHLLIDAGYSFDFVGSMSGVAHGPARHEDFDQDHEGHSGWTTAEVNAELDAWVPSHAAEIFLVHLGTNDVLRGQDPAVTLQEIEFCVETIRVHSPDATIILAEILPVRGFDLSVLYAGIRAIAAAQDSLTSRVVAADLHTGFEPRTHFLPDRVHPTDAGELWMAERFFEVLRRFLVPPPSAMEDTNVGAGCGGEQVDAPSLERIVGQAPTIGESVTMRIGDLSPTATAAFGLLGLEPRLQPLDLSPAGMPGCMLHVIGSRIEPLTIDVVGSTTWTMSLPELPGLIGLPLYQQAAVMDASANALGVLLSNSTTQTVQGR